MNCVRLVVPVFNDWISFRQLLIDLDRVAATLPFQLFVSAIDDGSTEESAHALASLPLFAHLVGVEIVHLKVNVGHQRAIAVGLCIAVQDDDFDAVLVMDADGEDPPDTIPLLTHPIGDKADFCYVAQRRKRVETLTFRFFYLLYKIFFKTVTGKSINFGNFSILSRSYAARLVMVSELWNNLPAAILRSRLPITAVPIHRGRRYAGQSKMNFTSLVVHGLSSISVYADTIFVRLILLSTALFVLSVFLIAFVFSLRVIAPRYATPGWATTVSFGMIIILLQVVFTAISSILMLLNNRVQRLVVPLVDFHPYVARRHLLFGHRFTPQAHTPRAEDIS